MKKIDVILSSAFLFAAATGGGSFAFGQGFGDYTAPTTRQTVPAQAPLSGQSSPIPQTRPTAATAQTPQTRPTAATAQSPQARPTAATAPASPNAPSAYSAHNVAQPVRVAQAPAATPSSARPAA
ncbi:MAG: hypothetical protein IKK39_12670, partial [Thermoguttaceae bacterium]|nr:hypothetical protein [Thermoguttaceae bacterium]